MDSSTKSKSEKQNLSLIAKKEEPKTENVQLIAKNVLLVSENVQLLAENVQLNGMMSEVVADLKTTKNAIIGFMQEMKLLDENLEMEKSPNYASVSMSIISIARGKGKASDQFKSLQSLLPLIEKYKNL